MGVGWSEYIPSLHLKVLQWARAQRCPWGAETCAAAAKNGHLDVLKWARAHGCPWDK